jgi:hypothetical protein
MRPQYYYWSFMSSALGGSVVHEWRTLLDVAESGPFITSSQLDRKLLVIGHEDVDIGNLVHSHPKPIHIAKAPKSRVSAIGSTSTYLFLALALAMSFFTPCSAILTQSYGKSIRQFWLIFA